MPIQHEGPSRIQPVRRTFLSCSLCKHFESHLQRSGRDPIYHTFCTHPVAKAKDYADENGLMISAKNGTETPPWCPVKKETD